MLRFQLTPLEMAATEEFNSFARRVLRPFAARADEIADIPHELLRHEEVLNFMRVFVPVEMGGGWHSLSSVDRNYDVAGSAQLRLLMCEELAYGDASLLIALPGAGLAQPIISELGSREQQEKCFGIFFGREPRWASFAMSEPQAGSDFGGIATTAIKQGDSYVLNGTKWFIGNGARADWYVVFASTKPGGGQLHIRTFIVDRDTPGLRVGRTFDTMGMRAVRISEIVLDNCRVPVTNVLGSNRAGFKGAGIQGAMRTFNLMRPCVAAMAVGIGRAALEYVEGLAKQNGARHVFAHNWRGLDVRIQTMKSKLRAASLVCRKAAWLYDQCQDNSMEASMAKALSAKVGMWVCSEAMDISGLACLDGDALLEKLFRDIKAFDFLEGTGEIQRLMVARALLRRQPSMKHS